MSCVIHVNDKISHSGGVEGYIEQLLHAQLPALWEFIWIGVVRTADRVEIQCADPAYAWSGALRELHESPVIRRLILAGGVFHAHSLSDPNLMDALFAIAPVVRTIHEPRIFCPGQGKFWAGSEEPCQIPFGSHCLVHAYTKKCCNRHPKRLLRQFANTRYEVKAASAKYAALLANSNYTMAEALKVGFREETMHLLHLYTETTPEPEYDSTEFRIVFSGRLSRTKGLHYLLDAVALVSQQCGSVHLDVLGAGHDEAIFKAQAEALGITPNVTFHGWADSETVGRFVDQAALVAFPSIYPEAFGLAGIEAMMRGKPVVGFDVGGVKDWLRHGVTGFLLPVKDTQGFADAIVRIIHNDELSLQMGRRAREIALAEFSEEVHMQKLIQVYKDALRID